jgi:DNA-binding transcriptional ArsR family regulator
MTIENDSIPAWEILKSGEAVKAYVHPVRMDMLRLLGEKSLTLSQLAKSMDTVPANLSRHLAKLLRASLVRLVGTKDTGRNLEKYYRASALSYGVAGPDGKRERRSVALEILAEGLSSASRSPVLDDLPAAAFLRIARFPRARFPEFAARLEGLTREFLDSEVEDGEPYAMSLALYPSKSRREGNEEVRI